MSGRRLVLWRHGRTSWNALSKFQGQENVPLDEVGQDQVQRAASILATMQPSHIVSSDLDRAQATGQALADLVDLTVVADADLRETYCGLWQGMTKDEIKAAYPHEYAIWGDDVHLRPGVHGETRLEVAERVVRGIQRGLEQTPTGGTLVVASHGGALRAALGQLLALEPTQWSILGVLANAQWSVLTEIAGSVPSNSMCWRLQEYNAGSLPQVALADDK